MFLIKQHMLWGLLVLNYALCSLLRDSAMIVLPPLMTTLSLSAAEIGLISSIYHYAYGSVQSVSGTSCDRWGPVRLCGTCLLVCVVGILFFAVGSTTGILSLGRLLMGFGMGPAFAAVLVFQAKAFPAKNYPVYAALSTILSNLGNVLAISPLGAAVDVMGKYNVFIFLAVITLLLAAVMLVSSFLCGNNTNPMNVNKSNVSLSELFFAGYRCIFDDNKLLSVTLFWCVSMGMQLAFLGLWGVPWYETVWKLHVSDARKWMTVSAFAVMFGALLGGVIGRKFSGNTTKIVFVAYILMVSSWTSLLLATFLNASIFWGGMSGVLLGFFSGNCNVVCSSHIRNISHDEKLGAILGSVSMFIFVSGIIVQWGAGLIMSYLAADTGSSITTNGFLLGFGGFIVLSYFLVPFFLNINKKDLMSPDKALH